MLMNKLFTASGLITLNWALKANNLKPIFFHAEAGTDLLFEHDQLAFITKKIKFAITGNTLENFEVECAKKQEYQPACNRAQAMNVSKMGNQTVPEEHMKWCNANKLSSRISWISRHTLGEKLLACPWCDEKVLEQFRNLLFVCSLPNWLLTELPIFSSEEVLNSTQSSTIFVKYCTVENNSTTI